MVSPHLMLNEFPLLECLRSTVLWGLFQDSLNTFLGAFYCNIGNALVFHSEILLCFGEGLVWLDSLLVELHLDFFRDRIGLPSYRFP